MAQFGTGVVERSADTSSSVRQFGEFVRRNAGGRESDAPVGEDLDPLPRGPDRFDLGAIPST
ncbi:hypothetical protein [Halorarum salinum]|uniref:Uncharacterized protein n=1 Tax=Halorarum salinum TaxID=2743089 RepID=A0A7D5LA26_9EURY|nr:hypothetical protein [Halobaculum salinum]QLG61753.1 hypothetical protein HUG12_08430 [Halobaculum salinum]